MQGLTKDLNTGRDSVLRVDPGSSETVEGAFRKDKQISFYRESCGSLSTSAVGTASDVLPLCGCSKVYR